jgi:hypothetical protein
MAHTIEPGVAAHSAATSRLIRRSPGSVMPSLVSSHAAAWPGGDRLGQACPHRADAGYPGDYTNGRRIPGEPEDIGAMTIAMHGDTQIAATVP